MYDVKQVGSGNGASEYNRGLANVPAMTPGPAETAKDIVATISKQAQHLLSETRTLADNVAGPLPERAECGTAPIPSDLLTQLRDIRYTLEAAANNIHRAREHSGL